MAKVLIKKVLFFVHYSERATLLKRLQDSGIIHISEIDNNLRDTYGFIHFDEVQLESHLESVIARLENAIKFLEPFAKKKSFVESLYEIKEKVDRNYFFRIANCIEPGSLLVQVETLQQELAQISQEESNLKALLDFISPWSNLDYEVENIKSTKDIIMVPGTLPSKYLDSLDGLPLVYQTVHDNGKRAYIVAIYHKKDEDIVRSSLQEREFEHVEFHGLKGKPSDIIQSINKDLERIGEERAKIGELIEGVSKHYIKLQILHDYYYSVYRREITDNKGLKTEHVSFYTGYVRKDDLEKLDSIFGEFRSAFYEIIEPAPGEEPPVLLENKKAFKPFEGLVKMYGLPSSSDPDPTPIITPFFLLFFGICFGDAAYGLILALLSFFIMKKLKISAPLLWILIVGGIISMVFGVLTGGWFGDFFERANIQFLNAFRRKLMLFDPMEDVMVFFSLTLVLGFIQIIVGLAVNAYKRIKEGDILGAISLPIAWIVILVSLVYKAVLANKINIPIISQLSTFLILICVALMVLFSSRKSRNFAIRIIKGAYNVYNGVGFIGDLLSYVRLMALGMTSAGIAMAINILTLLVWQIPIAGYILAPIVFIFGHLFSVVMNILGSIVHPLRLQYVEFFKQFYDDGGKPFHPLSWEGKYVELVESKSEEKK